MKAIRKSDGKVIEVKPQRFMEQDGSMYAPSELDFNVEESEEVTIDGWVAIDEDGFISLFNDKPTRDYCDKNDIPYGFWDEANGHHLELPITSFPSLTWDSDPLPVTITIIKPKKQ